MKFKITDECGRSYSVVKRDTETSQAPLRFRRESTPKSCNDAEEKDFTEDEIKLLKKLLEKADDLLALLEGEREEKKEAEEVEEEVEEDKDGISVEEFDADEELLEIPEDEDGVQDSDDEEEQGVAAHDSKKSYGAIETKVVDSPMDIDEEIALAWAKRYGGNK